MLQVSHVSVIYCHGMHSCIILRTCLLGNNAFSVLHHTIEVTLHYYVTSLRDSLCLGTFAQGFIMLLPRSSLAITIQGFKKHNLAAKRTFNNLVNCCICSLLSFTRILSPESPTTCDYNPTVLYGLYLNNLYTNPGKIK